MTQDEFYTNLNQANELYHHGVKGQKWGVRKYQNPDGSLTAEGQRRQNANIVNRTKDRFGAHVDSFNNAARNTGKALNGGHVWTAGSELMGYGRMGSRYEAHSKAQQKLKEHSKTKLGQAYHDQRAKNFNELGKYSRNRQHESVGERVVNSMLVNVKLIRTPYHRLSGRTTTYGREMLNGLLTGGAAGLAMDAKYLHDKKKNQKK